MTFLYPASSAGRFAGLRARLGRGAILAISIAMSLNLSVQPAAAQAISIIRDTEIERVLRGYEEPLLVAAGVDPATVKLYLVDDSTINAFATQSPANDEAEEKQSHSHRQTASGAKRPFHPAKCQQDVSFALGD